MAATPLVIATVDGHHCACLPPDPGPRGEATLEQAVIEQQPVCIGSSVESAGDLGDTLYYRAVALDNGRVAVGYFAFFTQERPWGNNWLTWSFFPALSLDLVYSRALLVAPGLQRVLYGAGDVEAVQVVYNVAGDGSLQLDHAFAEDKKEKPIALSREDAFSVDPTRPTFYTEIWSHQLGARGAHSKSDLVYERCYQGNSIRPLPDSVARQFHLDHRADPGHVELLNGRRLDVSEPVGDAVARTGP